LPLIIDIQLFHSQKDTGHVRQEALIASEKEFFGW